jgi:hypothetical protein
MYVFFPLEFRYTNFKHQIVVSVWYYEYSTLLFWLLILIHVILKQKQIQIVNYVQKTCDFMKMIPISTVTI